MSSFIMSSVSPQPGPPQHETYQPRQQNQPRQQGLLQYTFVQPPLEEDYHALARHVDAAAQESLHSALWPQRNQVAQGLRRMSEQPEQDAHQAAYQALRLLVW